MGVSTPMIRASTISYADAAASRPARALIRLMENSTGRLGLMRRAAGFEGDLARGGDFFDVMVDRYGLELDILGGTLDAIPATGPVVCLANHPYGILDGLMLGHIMARCRGDFRIMAHAVFSQAPDLEKYLLPISFDGDKAALAMNLQTRKAALAHLGCGGAVGLFPGGTVSTGAGPFSRPMDPTWRSFAARLIARSGATVVPIYFDGHTSRLFQIASHLHPTLRLGLLIQEFRKRIDGPVRVVIGKPLPPAVLAPLAHDAKAMMDFLRKATYGLSLDPAASTDLGYDFEDRHRADR